MTVTQASPPHYDFIIVGSGFGGSVSALRLVDKGHRVLVLEKGRRFRPEDFPRTNWNLRKWLWMPQLGMRGIFQMSFLEHLTVLHGVGVGGGSLVYASTLPIPKTRFFQAPSWRHLGDWENDLAPHYRTVHRMLGAAKNPKVTRGDEVVAAIARDLGREKDHHPTEVAVYFGKAGERVSDPYFGGEGPDRVGCTFCGGCMTGCRVGSKNTLDHNYLYLAEKRGARVESETEVLALRPRPGGGYVVEVRGPGGKDRRTADQVVLSGGVMGTLPLLLEMQADPAGLPQLSSRLGDFVRTNSESLLGVLAPKAGPFSEGIAITSILHTDDHSHFEPVRYGEGSGFFRLLALPHVPADSAPRRLALAARALLSDPRRWARAFASRDFARDSQILLYMRTLEGTISLRRGRSLFTGFRTGVVSTLNEGTPQPAAFMPEATDLARRFAEKVGGVTLAILTETVLGTPTTAHILGGAVMGRDAAEGVIDAQHRVFGYPGLYVIDGSAVSANPGVNPSLTIAALAERAMTFIPPRAA